VLLACRPVHFACTPDVVVCVYDFAQKKAEQVKPEDLAKEQKVCVWLRESVFQKFAQLTSLPVGSAFGKSSDLHAFASIFFSLQIDSLYSQDEMCIDSAK